MNEFRVEFLFVWELDDDRWFMRNYMQNSTNY